MQCAKEIFFKLDRMEHFPEILICVDRKRKMGQTYERYGVLPYAETRITRLFAEKCRRQHIRYHVDEVMLVEEDLTADAKFQMVSLKYLGACVSMYGMESISCCLTIFLALGLIPFMIYVKSMMDFT